MQSKNEESKGTELREVDHLKYVGNQVPPIIRFVWTAFIIFAAVYLAKFMWPDLKNWLK